MWWYVYPSSARLIRSFSACPSFSFGEVFVCLLRSECASASAGFFAKSGADFVAIGIVPKFPKRSECVCLCVCVRGSVFTSFAPRFCVIRLFLSAIGCDCFVRQEVVSLDAVSRENTGRAWEF